MSSRPHFLSSAAILLLAGICIATFQVAAQEGASDTTVNAQMVEARLAEIQASSEVDEGVRATLIEEYRKALGFIQTAEAYAQRATEFSAVHESAPRETQAIRAELEQMAADSSPLKLDLPDDASSEEIAERLQTERANQAAVATKVAALEQQIAAESNRPREVRDRLLEAGARSKALAAEPQSLITPDQPQLVREAQRWVLLAESAAINAEIQMLDQELLHQAARIDLLQAQRDFAAYPLVRINDRIVRLEELLASQRRSETERVMAESARAVVGPVAGNPLIRAYVQESIELSQYLQQLNNDLEKVDVASRAAATELSNVQQMSQAARQRIEIAGLSQVLGVVLHKQRRELPGPNEFERKSRSREATIAQLGLRDIQFEAERRALQDKSQYIADKLAGLPAAEQDTLAEPMRALVSGRKDLLKNAIRLNNDYLRALEELEFQESQLQLAVSEFSSFIDERLLWVRNKDAVGVDSLRALPGEIISFLAPGAWLDAVRVLLIRLTEASLLWLALFVFGVLRWKRSVLRMARQATAKWVGSPRKDGFSSTALAFGISVLLALPWPLLAFTAGWELIQSVDASVGAKAIGYALLQICQFLFFLSVLRSICAPGGLAEAHFKWPTSATRALRIQLDQLLVTFLLPCFVLVFAVQGQPVNFGGELARISFVFLSVGLLVFLVRILRPGKGILDQFRQAQGNSKYLSWFWLVLGSIVPVAFAIATLVGYLYSAATLISLLIDSLWLIMALVIAHQMASRWLLVVNVKLQLKVAREQYEAALALQKKQADASSGGEDAPLPIEEVEIDVATIGANTHKLLRLTLTVCAVVGMGAIWSTVLPAFALLRKYTLWSYLDGEAGQEQLVPVTLADLLLTLAYIFIAIVAARTMPSLVDAILRQRESIKPGTRVAIATLTRYAIVLLGVSLVANAIGFNWGRIQWLVAALGVGIGFGLQEIIANFISGIIILVERPVRVGDLVTVGDTSGTVTRIQIRATTVTNFDRQELLVPNKEFITGRVLNWSLSDEVTRLVINVGVAYGSDMPKALDLVRQVVEGHELVLDDPAPLITFESFGDNSLNMTARCFIGVLNKRREVISDLNLAINQKFNEAGIVIAFPQRDVHLDTSAPLDIRIQHAPPAP